MEFGEAEYRQILQATGVGMSREMAEKVWMAQHCKEPTVVAVMPEMSPEEFRRWRDAKSPEEAEEVMFR